MRAESRRLEDRFFAVAQSRPQAIAVAFATSHGWKEWTYLELAHRAREIATALTQLGVTQDQPVGVAAQRHPDTLAAMLGILAAGACYLPLDMTDPPSRLGKLCQDAGVKWCLAAQEPQKGLPVTVHQIDELIKDSEPVGSDDRSTGVHPGDGESPAYILFTSGSTGEPKGVVVPHRAVRRLVDQPNFLSIDPNRVFLWLAPLAFDASVLEIWGPLCHGAKCVVFPEGEFPTTDRLGETIRSQGVDVLWLTASLFNAIVDRDPTCLEPIKDLLVGGEALSVPHVRKALAALPQTRLINGYGPTENTTFTACYEIPRPLEAHLTRVPIGYPITGTGVLVVDDNLTPVGPDQEGELLALGEGLALGYLRRPEGNQEKFITIHHPSLGAVRAYRTGDRVIQGSDGLLDFVGRADNQVKIEGHRIEPGEIEAALARLPGIAQVRVLAKVAPGGGKRLIAYLVAQGQAPDIDLMRSSLSATLPAFMIPHFFMVMDRFPLTPNGKLDVAALPEPWATNHASKPNPAQADEPANPLGRVARLWREILGREPASVDVNFFDAGGTSMDAIRLLEALESLARRRLEPHFVFSHPTPRRQAEVLFASPAPQGQHSDRGDLRRAALAQRRRGAP